MPRSSPLSDEQRRALRSWSAEIGLKSVAGLLGTTEKSVYRWAQPRGRVDHRLFSTVCEALRQRSLNTDTGDPAGEIRRLFDDGRRLHYGSFDPQGALDVLQQVVFHPGINAVPPAQMLYMLAVTMSIYRQSFFTADGDFLRCGQRCLWILSQVNLERGDELTAAICTAAWELVAVTVQRGWASDGLPLLERISGILDERNLWPCLPLGRERSIRRMTHWGRVVAYENFDDVRDLVHRQSSPIDALLEGSLPTGVEGPNTVSQKMCELLRFSMATRRMKDRDQAVAYFESTIRPILAELARSSGNLAAGGAESGPIRASFTPSTATAVAFEAFLVALHLQPHDASDIAECATQVTRRIRRASGSAIMLQMPNSQTRQVISTGRALGKLHPEILEMFAFVNDITNLGKTKLHALANQLLDHAEQ